MQKRIRSLIQMACALTLWLPSVAAWAHDEAEELGHHWEVPEYLGEIRLQLATMAILTCAILSGRYISRVRAKKEMQ